MRYFAFFIIAISLVSLYSSITGNNNSNSGASLVEDGYSANWLTDFSVVKVRAKEEGKPILMDFTGSDWCGWCIKLKKEVFSKRAFINYANEHLILMTVDFPNGKQQEESLKDQNTTLLDTYGVNSFPTIILVDAEGKVLAETGYRRGGSMSYVDHLISLLNK